MNNISSDEEIRNGVIIARLTLVKVMDCNPRITPGIETDCY